MDARWCSSAGQSRKTPVSEELGILRIRGIIVNKKYAGLSDNELCIIIAGSQGQPGSSLVRAVFGEHPLISISKAGRVVFSRTNSRQ